MADFKIALKLTGGNEGGYANDKNDHGGETFAGIARNYWPNWKGWGLIDGYKRVRGIVNINSLLKAALMVQYINQFYKQNFWDVNSLDNVSDQQIANTVYDFGVNAGTGRAAKYLQEVVGAKQDGQIGADTLKSVNTGNPKLIYSKFNALRLAHYMGAASQPGQHQFLASWESRLKPYIG